MSHKIPFSRLRHYRLYYLLVLPSFLAVATFAYYPCLSAIYHAFYDWNGDDISEFIGLQNFREAFTDSTLWYGFGVISILVLANLIRMIPSIATAVVIHRMKSERAAYWYRVLFVVPMIIPMMVALLVWKFIFDPSVGVLNWLLNASGLMHGLVWLSEATELGWFQAGVNPVWLGDANLVIPALIIWGFPWVGVVSVLIYLAGLQNINPSVYESGKLDGVGPLGCFFSIELPLILTQVRINLVLMIIGTLQSYGLILILLNPYGGPNGVADVPGLYMFRNAFIEGRAGYACAIGMIIFVFILLLTEVNNRFVRIEK